MKVKLEELSSAINSNDKKLMLNLSKEITNYHRLSKSIKNEADKLNKSIQESGVVTSQVLIKKLVNC